MLEDEGYELLTTDEMIELLAAGYTLTLPETRAFPGMSVAFADEDLAHLELDGDMNDIVAIEYVGEEEVQCIYIDDPEHLYMTDGFIPTHNTSNIVFLKSTDDSMIETLSKMSGTRHQTYTNSKQITRDVEKLWMRNAGAVSYTMQTSEEPVISYNDMAFISERNSIVFRAGDAPIWNRNETILPMSWRLFMTKITQPGKDYTLQTIPTLSSAIDFDVRQNQPNFEEMLEKRIRQASLVPKAVEDYKKCFNLDDYQISRLDIDVYAETIMGIVNARKNVKDAVFTIDDYLAKKGTKKKSISAQLSGDEVNTEQIAETKRKQGEWDVKSAGRFAGKLLSSVNLWDNGLANHQFDDIIVDSFLEIGAGAFRQDSDHFTVNNDGALFGRHGKPFILVGGAAAAHEKAYLEEQTKNKNSRVYSEEENIEFPTRNAYTVTDDFLHFLAQQDSWDELAGGRFEQEMARRITDRDN